MYRAMSELIEREKPDMVACHILECGSMLEAIEKNIPYATLSTTPMGWCGIEQPGHICYTNLPLWMRRSQARFLRFFVNRIHKWYVRPYCRKRQIPIPIKNMTGGYEKASVNLGFWSELLKSKASDDPPKSHICGFVRDKHIKDWPDVPEAIRKLFAHDRKPVVIGLGSTASLHGAEIFQRTAHICTRLDWPCLLIGKDADQFADPDRNILTVDFAPYGWVFPRAGLIIHHGGLNTTAETLRAGVPGLVIPHAYDQFDNAMHTQKMGLAKRIRTADVTSEKFMLFIRQMLNDQPMHMRAKEFSLRLQSEPDGADIAAEQIINAISQ